MARWEGLDDAMDAFDDLEAESGDQLSQSLMERGEEIMTDVKASEPGKGVPRDTGALASTAAVKEVKEGKRVELSFGGPAAPYALVQHERVDYRHDLGEAKYLERGWQRAQQGNAVEKALQKNLEAARKYAARN